VAQVGWTPLHHATWKGDLELVNKLLAAGAGVSVAASVSAYDSLGAWSLNFNFVFMC
jgi:ankyrin repeat protein